MQLSKYRLSHLLMVFLMVFFVYMPGINAKETSPGNRALSYLELNETYKIIKEEHVSYSSSEKEENVSFSEWKLALKDKNQGGERVAYVVKTGADKWVLVIHLGSLDAGPLAIEDTVVIYSKGGKLPKEKSEELTVYMGETYKNHVITTDRGINLYTLIGLNQKSTAVQYMFHKLNIKKSSAHKIYGYMDTYDNSKKLNLTTELATEGNLDFPSWLHLKPKDGLTLELDCSIKMSHLFSLKPKNPLSCNSLFVNMASIFDYGKVSFDLDTRIGIGKKKINNHATKKEDLEKFSQYSFFLEGAIEGKNENDLVNVHGVGLRDVKLEYEQSFFKSIQDGSADIRKDLPKSVYTFGGNLTLGKTDVGLFAIFAPTTTEPVNVGLVGTIDKVTFADLTNLAFSIDNTSNIKAIPQNTQDKMKKLPLKQIYLSNVTIAYTPEASRSADIKQEGFTFKGSLTILNHLAGNVNVNVSEEGVRTKDEISPFSLPGFEVKAARLDIFIPTAEKKKFTSAFINNLNFILIDLKVEIVGVKEQIKFKIGLSGFSFIFRLNLTHDLSVQLIALAPVSAITDVSKFKFSADINTGNPKTFSSLVKVLKNNLSSSATLNSKIEGLGSNLSSLKNKINLAISKNSSAQNAYKTARNKAKENLNKILHPIEQAEDFFKRKNKVYQDYHSSWLHWKHKRNHYHWYQLDKIAKAESNVIYYEGLKDSAWAAVKLAKKSLAIIRSSIHFIPVDAYPAVIEKLAVYRVTQYALSIAKGALFAAEAANKDLKNFSNLLLNNLNFFDITNMTLSGDIKKGHSLSATLKITGASFNQDWSVSPTVSLGLPNKVKNNFRNMVKSLFSPVKYAAMRVRASHTPSSYTEYPPKLVLDYVWQEHNGIQNLAPSGWLGRFSDIATNNNHLYVLTTTNKVKQYAINEKKWKHVGVGPANREFKHIAVNKQGDVAFVTKNNNLWVNRRFISAGGGPRGLDVGLNDQALWFIDLNHHVNRFDLKTARKQNFGGYAKRIDVAEDDIPWITGKGNIVSYLAKTSSPNAINRRGPSRIWRRFPRNTGAGLDIAIAQPGKPWVVGTDHALWSYIPSIQNWKRYAGHYAAVSIAPNNLPAMVDAKGKLQFLLKLDNKAQDIGYVSFKNNHAALIVNSDFNLWQYSHNNWQLLETNIARVDGNIHGDIWAVSKNHQILHRATGSNAWKNLKGWAADISVSDNGSVYIIGRNSTIAKYLGNGRWRQLPGGADRISVGPDGIPWVINAVHNIWRFSGSKWLHVSGAAHDISIASDNSVWVLGTDDHVWKYSRGNSKWTKINGAGKAITTDDKNLPWVVGEDFGVWQSNGPGSQ